MRGPYRLGAVLFHTAAMVVSTRDTWTADHVPPLAVEMPRALRLAETPGT